MAIIDAQVHAYERDHPGRPWRLHKMRGPDKATGEDHIEAMDDAGVDGALLVSPWSLYGFDLSYLVEVRNRYPGRFAMVAPVDPLAANIGEQISEWSAAPGAVGIRLIATGPDIRGDDGRVGQAVRTAERHHLPVCIMCTGKLPLIRELASLYPDAQFVVDHLGLPQPFEPPPPADPFGELQEVIELAQFPNVALKISGACTLSHRPFPFDDLWEPLGRIFDAFGVDRCMWGTDWTRAVSLVGYRDSVEAFRQAAPLSAAERNALMGGTVQRIFGWAPA